MVTPIQKCGVSHWLSQPCPRGICKKIGPSSVLYGGVMGGSMAPPAEEPEEAEPPNNPSTAYLAVKNWRKKNHKKYNAYMREYMRRRRSGEKS